MKNEEIGRMKKANNDIVTVRVYQPVFPKCSIRSMEQINIILPILQMGAS